MTTNIGALLVAAVAWSALLTGCEKTTDAPKPETSTSAASSTSASPSVAAPSQALPSSDAAMQPKPPAAAPKTSDADGPTQATPKELSKEQESGTMPLAGQANNHSTPATTNETKSK